MEELYPVEPVKKRPQSAKQRAVRHRLVAGQVPQFATLPELPHIPEADLLTPDDPRYKKYLLAANLRTTVKPALRAMCKTSRAVAQMVIWVRAHNLSFAVRGGGHSYEGFSQNPNVVIDVRLIDSVSIIGRNRVKVGAGASLGIVYKKLSSSALAFVAGSCPTVGVAGHTLGGGYGLLGRAFGLSCDNLISVELVIADGSIITADTQNYSELFWACRGGGGGTFGIATHFHFQIHSVRTVQTFGVSWTPSRRDAIKIFDAWQAWAPRTENAITSILKINKDSSGALVLRCMGQSIDPNLDIRSELNTLISLSTPSVPLTRKTRTFFAAVNYFAGGWAYPSQFFKAKSDFVFRNLSQTAIASLIDAMRRPSSGNTTVICDAYGGLVRDIQIAESSFPHRRAIFSMQYYLSWSRGNDTTKRLSQLAAVYMSMRPHVTGASYVNYCDLDLADWASSYWDGNLGRLKRIKLKYDPTNLFRHVQSVPL